MAEEQPKPVQQPERVGRTRTVRRSIFWPLVLIALGVIFLLNNTGRMTGDLWENVLRFWPVLFILMGLDGILRREGVAGSSLVMGLGVVFLLGSLGYLELSVVGVLLYVWPLFLVAAGFDLLIGRRSWLLSFLGAILILVILAGALYGMQVSAQQRFTASESLNLPLEGAQQARISVDLGAGSLRLRAMPEPVALVMGSYPASRPVKAARNYQLEDGTAIVALEGVGDSYFFPSAVQAYDWDLQLARDIPIDLTVDLGAGEAALDLERLNLGGLNVDLGLGLMRLVLPEESSFSGEVKGAVGQITILVPEGAGARIETDNGLTVVLAGDGIEKQGDVYFSLGYAGADYKISLKVSQAVGIIVIQQQ